MIKVKARFWFHSEAAAREIENRLQPYGAKFVKCHSGIEPYNTCVGNVAIIFNEETICDFDRITSLAERAAVVSDVNVGGRLCPLKDYKRKNTIRGT